MLSLILAVSLSYSPTQATRCFNQKAQQLNRGVTQQAFGAPLLFGGIIGVLSGAVGFGISRSEQDSDGPRNDPTSKIFFSTAIISLATTTLGIVLLNNGRTNVAEYSTWDCLPIELTHPNSEIYKPKTPKPVANGWPMEETQKQE